MVDVASMTPLLLLRCKAFRVEPCPGRKENASWSVGPQAAAALLLACNSPLSRLALQEESMLLVAQASPPLQVCTQVFACWVAAPVLLDVFGM